MAFKNQGAIPSITEKAMYCNIKSRPEAGDMCFAMLMPVADNFRLSSAEEIKD